MSVKSTILFVHGGWHGPVHFAKIMTLLEQNGFPTCCPSQPTYGGPATTDIYAAARHIRSEVEGLLQDGKEVIIICHSFGGIVTSEAIDESLGKEVREAQGLKGGVVRLIYMTAFILPLGQSLGSMYGEKYGPMMSATDDGYSHVTDPAPLFYHDLPEVEQKHWVSHLKPHPSVSQHSPLTYTAYKHHPVSYLYCTDDQAIPYELQKEMVRDSGIGVVDEHTCSASHSPFLSQPEAVLQVVQKITS